MSPMPNKQNHSSYLSNTNENDSDNNTSSINNTSSNNNNINNNCSMNNRNNGSVNDEEDENENDLLAAERRLNKNIKVKLCDFSFSQIMSPGKNILGMMGTVAYSGRLLFSRFHYLFFLFLTIII